MPPGELAAAIRQVHRWHKQVPPEVAAQIARHRSRVAAGLRNREIAELLFISEETAKVPVKLIMEKLGAKRPDFKQLPRQCGAEH